MPQVTGGRIAYRRTIQPEPYESKTAEVEFAFVINDDESPTEVAAEILRMARLEVHRTLGILKNAKAG